MGWNILYLLYSITGMQWVFFINIQLFFYLLYRDLSMNNMTSFPDNAFLKFRKLEELWVYFLYKLFIICFSPLIVFRSVLTLFSKLAQSKNKTLEIIGINCEQLSLCYLYYFSGLIRRLCTFSEESKNLIKGGQRAMQGVSKFPFFDKIQHNIPLEANLDLIGLWYK